MEPINGRGGGKLGALTALLRRVFSILPILRFAYVGKPQSSDIDRKLFWSILSSLGMRL